MGHSQKARKPCDLTKAGHIARELGSFQFSLLRNVAELYLIGAVAPRYTEETSLRSLTRAVKKIVYVPETEKGINWLDACIMFVIPRPCDKV